MITESFLNNAYKILTSDNSEYKTDRILIRDILGILEFYTSKEKIEIPVIVQNKFEFLQKLCSMRIDGKSLDNTLDSLLSSRYKDLAEFIQIVQKSPLSTEECDDIVSQIRLRKKVAFLLSNYDKLDDILTMIKDESFSTLENVVGDYEDVVKQLFINVMESNRCVAVQARSSLDFQKDDYGPVLQSIVEKYSKQKITATGIELFDKEILPFGGFETSRLYLFGGGSGSGKSTIMENFIVNSASKEQWGVKVNEKKNVYIYITLENTIDESFLRMYQSLFSKSIPMVLEEISQGVDIKKNFQKELDKTNSTIIIKYFRPWSITPLDLRLVLDDVIAEYGEGCIKGIFVDYLDLFRPDQSFELYRLELSHITLTMKHIAVEYKIPFITATQLTRSTYRVESSKELGLDQISESVKKIEHADFVCLLSKDPVDEHLVHGKVGKNRGGISPVTIDFTVDFSYFKFITAVRVINEKKAEFDDNSREYLDTPATFAGLGKGHF